MKRAVEYTSRFKKDFKRIRKRGYKIPTLEIVLEKIEYRTPLEPQLHDHALTGNWVGHRELHIAPDWLLIYKISSDDSIVTFVRTGTHADLLE